VIVGFNSFANTQLMTPYELSVLQVIKNSTFSDRFSLFSKMDREILLVYLASADVFVSLSESSFAAPVLEAMAFGLPIIIAKFEGRFSMGM
jgi:glycosyltransferase involved in cell wall biosynthesis